MSRTRPVRGTSNLYLGAEGGSRVLGRDSSARCIALVCGSQVREMGPCVGKKLPSHDPDSHFTFEVFPKTSIGAMDDAPGSQTTIDESAKNEECVGPASESAGKASGCDGCPNQKACAHD